MAALCQSKAALNPSPYTERYREVQRFCLSGISELRPNENMLEAIPPLYFRRRGVSSEEIECRTYVRAPNYPPPLRVESLIARVVSVVADRKVKTEG